MMKGKRRKKRAKANERKNSGLDDDDASRICSVRCGGVTGKGTRRRFPSTMMIITPSRDSSLSSEEECRRRH